MSVTRQAAKGDRLSLGRPEMAPGGADGGEAGGALHRPPMGHPGQQPRGEGFRRPGAVERRGRAVRQSGRMRQVDPNAERQPGDAARRRECALGQDAGAFGAAAQQVVRPFQPQRGRLRDALRRRLGQRHAGQQAPLRRLAGRTFRPQQDGHVEVARWRGPGATSPAAPGGLLPGEDGKALGLTRFRTAQQEVGGARQGRMHLQTPTRRQGRRSGPCLAGCAHPSRAAAAAWAAANIGAGQSAKSAVNRPVPAITIVRLAGARSRLPTGASKYITLTMRR